MNILQIKTAAGQTASETIAPATAKSTNLDLTKRFEHDSAPSRPAQSDACAIARHRLALAADPRTRAARAMALALLEIDERKKETGHGL
jgi:hypothetical protein